MELFVDDCTHAINIHFRSRCGARDLGSNFRPMDEFAGIAMGPGPSRATLRLIVGGALVEKNEHLCVSSPAAPDFIPLFEPSSDGLQHCHILRLSRQSCWFSAGMAARMGEDPHRGASASPTARSLQGAAIPLERSSFLS